MAKERKGIRKITPYDVFIIVAVLVLVALVGIKFLTVKGLTLKGTKRIELTFQANQVPNEVARNVEAGESLLVNNYYFGEVASTKITPESVETNDLEGNLILQESKIFKKVVLKVITEAVEGTNGYQRGNVKINIGENYNLYAGAVKLQAKLIEIKKLK